MLTTSFQDNVSHVISRLQHYISMLDVYVYK